MNTELILESVVNSKTRRQAYDYLSEFDTKTIQSISNELGIELNFHENLITKILNMIYVPFHEHKNLVNVGV